MLRRIGVAATLALALGIVPMAGQADPGPEGCAVVAGQGDAGPSTVSEGGATYGIVGGGSWTVTIVRPGVDDPIVISREHAAPEVLMDAVKAGDRVTCSADEGAVTAGKPA